MMAQFGLVFALAALASAKIQPDDKLCNYTGIHNGSVASVRMMINIHDGFQCNNTQGSTQGCVDPVQRCDGVNDCGDNSDEKGCPGSNGDAIGYIAAAVASVFFGSNFVPIKQYDMGDGLFFQWVLCASIWCVGAIVQLVIGSVPFEPISAIGGVSWATGNVATVVIVESIGLAQGMLLWGAANMIMGWAAARFGFFGIVPEVPAKVVLQDLGVVCAGLSVLAFALVKPTLDNDDKDDKDEFSPLLSKPVNSDVSADKSKRIRDTDTLSWLSKMSGLNKRLLGVSLSLIAGCLYSFAFDPSQTFMDNHLGASQNALHYVFSQFTGIFLASTFWFMLYAAFCRSRPNIAPEIILPSLVSGVMWAVAQTSWFIANQHLSQAVAYPIITATPGVIAALWGVVVFKEIRGTRNFMALALAFALTFAGVGLTAVSNN